MRAVDRGGQRHIAPARRQYRVCAEYNRAGVRLVTAAGHVATIDIDSGARSLQGRKRAGGAYRPTQSCDASATTIGCKSVAAIHHAIDSDIGTGGIYARFGRIETGVGCQCDVAIDRDALARGKNRVVLGHTARTIEDQTCRYDQIAAVGDGNQPSLRCSCIAYRYSSNGNGVDRAEQGRSNTRISRCSAPNTNGIGARHALIGHDGSAGATGTGQRARVEMGIVIGAKGQVPAMGVEGVVTCIDGSCR